MQQVNFLSQLRNKLSLGDGENVFKTEEDGWSLILGSQKENCVSYRG